MARPMRLRSRQESVAMLAALPARAHSELLLALRPRHGRCELHALEPGRVLERLDELARRAGLADELHALRLHGERLKPGVLRQELGQIAQERQGAQALGLHALEG